MFINGGCKLNLASQEIVGRLNIKTRKHFNPFEVAWVNDTFFLVNFHYVKFHFGKNFEECDVSNTSKSYFTYDDLTFVIEEFSMVVAKT